MIGYRLYDTNDYIDAESFDKIPDDIYEITCISNKLKTLPEWSTSINLQEIYCSFNELTILPEWTTLINLQHIDCSYNELTILPEWTTLINLKEIYCSVNKVTILPEWTTLINLQRIYCSNNQITTLPVTWTRFTRLNSVSYGNNPIEYIPPNLLRIINRQKQGQDIYNDTQSIHNHYIQECLKDSVNYLLSFKPSISDKIMFEQIKHKSLVQELLLDYSNDENCHSVLNVTFKEVLLAVWNKIIEYDNDVQDEIIKILNIEMLDSECKCFTGRLTRLVNVLNGFDENIKLQISDNEQMSNISKMLYEQYPNKKDYQRELRKAFLERGYNENDVQQWLHI